MERLLGAFCPKHYLADRLSGLESVLLLNDSVRRTPKTNPAAAVINSKMACGMTTVAKSTCVATGSRFWRTMIATKIVRNEAVMSFKLRIEAKTVPIRKIVPPLWPSFFT